MSSQLPRRSGSVRLDGADVNNGGVADVLDAARLIDTYPTRVILLGLVPDAVDLAVVRSRAVDNRLNDLVAAIVREVQSLGYSMVREPEAADRCRPIHNLARHFGM
jgi:hypothetical protein